MMGWKSVVLASVLALLVVVSAEGWGRVLAPEVSDDRWSLTITASGEFAPEIDSVWVSTDDPTEEIRVVVWIHGRATECMEFPDGRSGWLEVEPGGIKHRPLSGGGLLEDDCEIRVQVSPGGERDPAVQVRRSV